QLLIILDAINIVVLNHPFDVQGYQGNTQRIVRKDLRRDSFGWSNYRTFGFKAVRELLPESLEELNVLRFFAGELQKRSRSKIVGLQMGSCLVQHKGQDEFFDQPKDRQVSIPSDLIKKLLLLGI